MSHDGNDIIMKNTKIEIIKLILVHAWSTRSSVSFNVQAGPINVYS